MKKLFPQFVVFSLLLGLLLGCKPSEVSQTEANKEVILQFTEALNSGNLDIMDDLFKRDFVRHCQASGDMQIRNLEEYKQFQQQFLAAFPDAYTTNHIIIAEGDYVAGYATLTGTQKGPLGPLPSFGKKMNSDFLSIFRFEDGKIAELWVEWDNVALLTQLGHFPQPGESEE